MATSLDPEFPTVSERALERNPDVPASVVEATGSCPLTAPIMGSFPARPSIMGSFPARPSIMGDFPARPSITGSFGPRRLRAEHAPTTARKGESNGR